MNATRPKVLLLDLGNVTVRLRFEAFYGLLGSACEPVLGDAELRALFQAPRYAYLDYERGLMDGRAWHGLLRQRLGLRLDYAAWLELWNDCFDPNVGMERLVADLRGQVRFWGLSNTNAEHLEHLKKAHPVLGAFEGITASCEVRARKPEPAIYAAALKSLGVAASEALYLDDVEDFVRAGEAHGIPAFHYTFNDGALRLKLRSLGFQLPD